MTARRLITLSQTTTFKMSAHKEKRVATTPTNHRCRRWINITAVWFIVPVLIFHAKAGLDDQDEWFEYWAKPFYIWLFITHVFMWCIIVTYDKFYWKHFAPFLFYSIARACVEIWTAYTGENPNKAQINGVLFLIAVFAAVFLTIKDLINRKRL